MSSVSKMDPEKLVSVMTDPEFLVAQQLEEPDVVEAWVEELSRSDDRLVLKLHSRQYARGLFSVDRGRTEISVATYTWDLRQRRCTWAYRTARGDLIHIEGIDHIEVEADGTRLTNEFTIEVRVPLVGRHLERRVLSQLDRRKEVYVRVLREFYRKLP